MVDKSKITQKQRRLQIENMRMVHKVYGTQEGPVSIFQVVGRDV